MTSRNHLIAHIHHPTERWSIGRMEEKKKIHQRASSSFSRKRRINYTRENLKTHRNDFVDRFLRRIRLGDDLDASKLGSECKHDDDVRVEIIYLICKGWRTRCPHKKPKRDEISSFEKGRGDLFFIIHNKKKGIFGDDRREEGDKEKKETQKEETKNPKHSIIQP